MKKHLCLLALTSVLFSCALQAPRSGVIAGEGDAAVRPQDDFYRSVNGGWLARTEIPADKAAYGAFHQLRDQSEAELRAIIEQAASAKTVVAGSEAQKVGDLYASFMDEARLEEIGLAPVQDLLTQVAELKDRKQIAPLLARLNRVGVETPMAFYIHQDAKDSTRYVADFVQTGLGMPDRDYFLSKDAKFEELRALYAQYAAQMLALAGVDNAAEHAMDILAFETQIAEKHWAQVDVRDAVKTYNPVTLPALRLLMPKYDWPAYLEIAGLKVDGVIVSQPSYFKALDKLLDSTSLQTLRSYLTLRVLDAYSGYLGKDFYDAAFSFNRGALHGIKQQQPRWKRGVAVVEGALGEALGKIYVEKHFPPENKQRMEALVNYLVQAYQARIETLEWMGPETRKAALLKLSKFGVKIGYPDRWRDYSALTIVEGDLIGNVRRASEFEHAQEVGKLGKPIDREEWEMTPQTVNAYYHPEKNEIVFPAAILRPPFFDVNAEDAVNFGAIGAVIGHEISHGFDDQGSRYDGDGNLRDWWTAEDRKQFEARAQKLVEQYSQYEPVKGFKVNGELTLGENIADLGGLAIAYHAYRLSLGGKASPVIDGLTGDQRFFIGWAQSWKQKTRDEALISQLKSGRHSPTEYRCNGVVVNVPEFYGAFGVKEGDRMYRSPAQRVSIW